MQSPLLKKIRIISSNIVFRLVFLILLLMVVFNFTPSRFIFVKAFNNQIKIFPGKYIVEENTEENFVWENINNVFLQYLAPDSELSEFNQANSAFIALQKTADILSDIEVEKDKAECNQDREDDESEEIDSIKEDIEYEIKNYESDMGDINDVENGNFETENIDSDQDSNSSQEEAESESEDQSKEAENDILDVSDEDKPELSSVYKKIKSLFSSFNLFAVFNKNSANAEEKLIQKSVIFSDFNVSFEHKDREVSSLNLYLSFAAQSSLENDNLSFEYSLGEIWEQITVFELNQEYSNFINGGYFNFQLSETIGWDEIENLKFKISYNNPKMPSENDEQFLDFFVFLDSLWIEIEYDNTDVKQEISESDYAPRYEEYPSDEDRYNDDLGEYNVDLLNTKTDFKISEKPELNFRYKKNKNLLNKIISGLISPFGDEYDHIKISADLRGAKGNKTGLKPEVRYVGEGEFIVKLPENVNEFKPGKYYFEIEIEDKGEVYQISQDFNWGVLAVNTNKAVYRPGENVYLQMGVLDDLGHTLCNADLFLEITAPSGKVNIFSTDDGTIFKNSECAGDTVIDGSDYYSYYSALCKGVYNIKLSAETENGNREIYDEFKVESFLNFELERIGPTRIFPLADYEMKMILSANESFQGNLVEYVPLDFRIKNRELRIKGQELEDGDDEGIILDSLFLIQNGENSKELVWQNLDIKPGDVLEFTYTFDAPDVSPEFYLLGSVKLADKHYFGSSGKDGQLVFEEGRQWQIASDAVAEYDYDGGSSTGTWTTPGYAWNSTPNDYAIRNIPKKAGSEENIHYLLADSNKATNLGYDINSVEIVLEAHVQDLQANITVYIQPIFGGTATGTSQGYGQAVLTVSDTLHYYDITNDVEAPSTWTWSDVMNLDVKLWGQNTSNSRQRMYYIDQISVRVDYTEPNDPPLGVFNSATFRTDASGVVDISMDVDDPDDDDVKAILQYVQGASCDFSSPLDPTLDETPANISETYGSVVIENDNFYQIGNASGWIKTDTATNTIQYDWDSLTDLSSGDDT
ncbi:MAG: hypothetical protein U9M94_00420, partial [Patescibacteria group bacterium]|nr:hypothetical protein [Patescibacteria group bacterium]